jgi:hypothetical protein
VPRAAAQSDSDHSHFIHPTVTNASGIASTSASNKLTAHHAAKKKEYGSGIFHIFLPRSF